MAAVLERVRAIDPAGERILVAVCSDHGMQTIRRIVDVEARLVEAGLKRSRDSRDVVVAPQGTAVVIHVAPDARAGPGEIVRWVRSVL